MYVDCGIFLLMYHPSLISVPYCLSCWYRCPSYAERKWTKLFFSRARISDNNFISRADFGQQFYFARGLTDINFISRADFWFLSSSTWWLSNILAHNSTPYAYFGNLVLRVASSMVSSHGWLFKSRFRLCETKIRTNLTAAMWCPPSR